MSRFDVLDVGTKTVQTAQVILLLLRKLYMAAPHFSLIRVLGAREKTRKFLHSVPCRRREIRGPALLEPR
jgi:hypothetical protein